MSVLARRTGPLRDEDVWSFDKYLAETLAEGLTMLTEVSHGYPECFNDDGEAWKAILVEMADGFRQYADASVMDAPSPEFTRAQELLCKWWEHLWS